jgi:4-hydroxybenzoyl-CoA thioesterase
MSEVDKVKSIFDYQVTFSDCDPAQMAYYPRIVEWCDWAHEKLWRSVGYAWHDYFQTEDLDGLPLLGITYSFHFPMRFGDKLRITSWIDSFEGRKFTVAHEIMNGEHLSAKAQELRTWAVPAPDSPKKIKATPVPEAVRRLFHKPV